MGEHKAEHTCMLMGRDCTTGGWPSRWGGGVTEEQECLSVCLSVSLASAADKCQHKAWYLLPRTLCGCEDSLSVSLYFLFFDRPRPSFPPSPSLFLNLPPSPRYIQYYISISSPPHPPPPPLIFMFHLLLSFLASLCTSSSFLSGILGHD